MLFSWLDSSEVDAFAVSLASEFAQKVPVDALKREARGVQRRLVESSDALLRRVERFSSRQYLNWFKRARFANSLKWRLLEAGYETKMVDELVLNVVKTMSVKKTGEETSGKEV